MKMSALTPWIVHCGMDSYRIFEWHMKIKVLPIEEEFYVI